jgi:hypothetical protein
MDDESTAAVSQPPEAEESQNDTTQSDYSSFLGPPSAEADLSAEERSAPGAEAEPELSGEGEAEAEPEQEAQPQTEVQAEAEVETEQPPSIEDRLKDLTQREQEEYAQRYPNAWKMLQGRDTPEDVKHLLLDKIDGDHEIQRRIAEEQALVDESEEPTLEAEPEQQQVQTQPDAAEARTAYYNQMDNLVKNQFDPQAIKEVGDTLLRMFNVNTAALNDPNVTPEDKAVLQGLVTSVQREAPVLARFMADAVATVVPHVVKPAIDAAMPGFTDMYERNLYGGAYENVRAQTDERGRPLYPGLPAYPAIRGTPEAVAFAEQMRQAADEIPGFHEMVFRDRAGRVMPEQQQAELKYTLLARHLSGQRVNPAVVAQAVETGRRLAGRADTRRQAARVTGAGRATNGLGRGEANDEEDPMMAALDREISRQEGNYRQPIRGRQSGR